MLDGPVRAGEFGQVVTCHLRLDLDRVEHLSIVDAHNTADHLWDDDHVTEVSLDDCGFLIGRCLLLGLAQLLNETHGLALETAAKPATGAGMDKLIGTKIR